MGVFSGRFQPEGLCLREKNTPYGGISGGLFFDFVKKIPPMSREIYDFSEKIPPIGGEISEIRARRAQNPDFLTMRGRQKASHFHNLSPFWA